MYGLTDSHIQKIQSVFVRFSCIEKVLLYGSRAKGSHKPGSDIDLSLFGENLDLKILSSIENELDDLLLPYKIDLSLYHRIENKDLKEHIDRVGVVFFEKSKINLA